MSLTDNVELIKQLIKENQSINYLIYFLIELHEFNKCWNPKVSYTFTADWSQNSVENFRYHQEIIHSESAGLRQPNFLIPIGRIVCLRSFPIFPANHEDNPATCKKGDT